MSFLSDIGIATKIFVGINISHHGYIEMLQIDKSSWEVKKYSRRNLSYNIVSREIDDYFSLPEVINSLFAEFKLRPRECDVVICLPNVYCSFLSFPSSMSKDELLLAAMSEAEQHYIFRKNTPTVSWMPVIGRKAKGDDKLIVAEAVQENVVLQLVDIVEEIGCKLHAIETSTSAFIRGIIFANFFPEKSKNNDPWSILLVSPNNCTLYSIKGSNWVNYYEMPMPIQSFEESEIYDSIIEVVNPSLENFQAEALLVVSEVNSVSAEKLASNLIFEGEIKYLDRNKYANGPFVPVGSEVAEEFVNKISIESVGTALYPSVNFSYKFNLVKTASGEDDFSEIVNLFGKDVEINTKLVQMFTGIIVVIIFIFFGLIGIISSQFNKYNVNKVMELEQKEKEYNEFIEKNSKGQPKIDINQAVPLIIAGNKKQVLYYDAISVEVPHNLWLTYFYSDASGAIAIKGESTSISLIYKFFKSIKVMITESDLSLTKLRAKEAQEVQNFVLNEDTNLYEFQLSNSNYLAKEAATQAVESSENSASSSTNNTNSNTNNNTNNNNNNNNNSTNNNANNNSNNTDNASQLQYNPNINNVVKPTLPLEPISATN